MKPVQLIDVTIRDGGFSNKWKFDKEYVIDALRTANETGIDYFEIGYLMNNDLIKPNDGVYRNVPFELITEIVNEVPDRKCKISVLVDYWRYNVQYLPPQSETGIDLIRVTCYMERVQEAIDYLIKVKALGYSVSLNVMCGSYLTPEIIQELKQKVVKYRYLLSYFYIADTFGSMTPDDTVRVLSKFANGPVPLGFHIHNNCELGMANMIASLPYVDIIDASYCSMGRGAGNVALEKIILYLVIKMGSNLNVEPMLNFLEYNNETINSFTGLLNVHPYRILDFPELTMYKLYTKLKGLTREQKIDYSLG